MVEKNFCAHTNPLSHSPTTRQKSHSKQRFLKSAMYFQSFVTPPRGRVRKFGCQETMNNQDKSRVADAGVFHPSNSPRQGSPKLSVTGNPSKDGSPRSSPPIGDFYAGAKFSEPPSPAALPKPPTHWTTCLYMASGVAFPGVGSERVDKCREITNQLKILLNVSA